MFCLKSLEIFGSKAELASLPEGKLLINTINAHSYNTARKDSLFAEALTNGDVLLPDGVSIVMACKWIKAKSLPKERIAGWDLFAFEMEKLERESEELRTKSEESKIVMFMGSSQKVLDLIVKRAAEVYPHLKVVTYSPPYKPEFSDEDNKAIIDAIHAANPDLLWIGMTAPKQEKWTYSHWKELNIHCHVITAKPKAHAFKNEMCFPLTKTKCELKKHPNSKFECFFNDFNRTKTSLFLPFPSKLIQDNLVCVLELQE